MVEDIFCANARRWEIHNKQEVMAIFASSRFVMAIAVFFAAD